MKSLIFSLLLVVGCFFAYKKIHEERELPFHLLNHVVKQVPDLITEEERLTLVQYIKDIGTLPTNLADVAAYKNNKNVIEHIGEGIPYSGEGKCPHHFMVPNSDRTMCVLSGRIDVGKHFLTFGGVEGIKEKAEKSVSRLLSFMHYAFDPSKFPLMEKLFHSEKFLKNAKDVCPPTKQYLDPFQVNFILQIPSQSVALHVDGVYFWGADRFLFPQWLLAVMKFSGLFENEFIDQIQVVTYLHDWEDPEREGEFVHFNQGIKNPAFVSPTPRFGSIVDGSKVVHAATIYQGKQGVPYPELEKDKPNVLRFLGNDKWDVFDGENIIANYTTDDLRISMVYRARCFASEFEAKKYKIMRENGEGSSLEEVLDVLIDDMRHKKGIDISNDISKLDLALLLMDTYIDYPRPQTLMPYNYCMASKFFPSLSPLVDLIC